MRFFRCARWILMTLLLSLLPASSYAGVLISVGFAPPALPVYEQPPCPEPGWMWTPGYWAYGPDGYYWVPGAWVPAPYEGALWTPGYWGWGSGLYVWHPGYWGHHVGYYGGVNYGFGYMGVGFVGGLWRGHDFVYNTAIVHVNNVRIHNTYIDRTVVEHHTIVNERHVAYAGGPGGINHPMGPDERMAMHEQHQAPTSFQRQHRDAAMGDHNSYFKNNGGRPQNLAVDRPMTRDEHMGPSGGARPNQPNTFNNHGGSNQPGYQNHPSMSQQYHENAPQQYHGNPQYQRQGNPQYQPHGNPNPQYQQPHGNPNPHYQPRGNGNPNENHQPHNEVRPPSHPEHENHDHGKGR
jgi:hypothetical protein